MFKEAYTNTPLILRCSFEDIEVPLAIRSDFEYTCVVTTSITVIWRAPHGAELIIKQDTVPFHAQLMCTQDVLHIVHLQELFHYL